MTKYISKFTPLNKTTVLFHLPCLFLFLLFLFPLFFPLLYSLLDLLKIMEGPFLAVFMSLSVFCHKEIAKFSGSAFLCGRGSRNLTTVRSLPWALKKPQEKYKYRKNCHQGSGQLSTYPVVRLWNLLGFLWWSGFDAGIASQLIDRAHARNGNISPLCTPGWACCWTGWQRTLKRPWDSMPPSLR